ncbi:MAG: hypothetical protein GEU88_07255 [Solirubrobacterales bacterium]|nr:hypothetical protein [Solirubrobacterales bacterium]
MSVTGKVVIALTVLALIAGATLPTPASAVQGLDRAAAAAGGAKLKKKAKAKTKKAVKKELPGGRTPGLSKPGSPTRIKVTNCAERRKAGRVATLKCKWKASGELRGRVPVRCTGRATFNARKKRVTRVSACKNREDPQAPLLAAPHDVRFGYFEDFSTHGDLWGELGASGADSFREGIAWKVLQPNPGGTPATWNWAPFDSVYARALATGVRPMWTFTSAPCWAAQSPCDPNGVNPVAAPSVGAYANAAAQIALRYPMSAAIEIWFEPNSAKFWGAPADPRGFSELVGAASAAIQATGTGVAVYSGGLAPGRAAADKLEMSKFLSRALAAGGIEGADAIGFHAVADVPFKPGNNPTKGYLGRLRINVQALDSELADAGVRRPIAVTELAFSTAGPKPYTDAQQAEALVSSYQVLRRIAEIPIVIVSRLLDNGDGSKVQGFGVVRSNGSKKPAYCRLAAARGAPTPAGCV